jgi:hypothetical protein
VIRLVDRIPQAGQQCIQSGQGGEIAIRAPRVANISDTVSKREIGFDFPAVSNIRTKTIVRSLSPEPKPKRRKFAGKSETISKLNRVRREVEGTIRASGPIRAQKRSRSRARNCGGIGIGKNIRSD